MYGFNHMHLNSQYQLKLIITTLVIGLSYLFLNLLTYSKFNLIPYFY